MKWRTCSQGMTYDAGEGLVVYFDPGSGTTHLVNEVAAWLLGELAASSLTTVQLRDRVAGQVENVSEPEVEKLVDTLIQELQSFDLIEVV